MKRTTSPILLELSILTIAQRIVNDVERSQMESGRPLNERLDAFVLANAVGQLSAVHRSLFRS